MGPSGFLENEARVGRPFGIFGGRSESAGGSSKFMVDEVRKRQALRNFLLDEARVVLLLRDFCWSTRKWGWLSGIFGGRS
jgi:hypothetical protein